LQRACRRSRSLMATNASASFKVRPDTIESLAINIIGLDRA